MNKATIKWLNIVPVKLKNLQITFSG